MELEQQLRVESEQQPRFKKPISKVIVIGALALFLVIGICLVSAAVNSNTLTQTETQPTATTAPAPTQAPVQGVPQATPQPTPAPTSTPTATPTINPTVTPTPTIAPTPKPTLNPQSNSLGMYDLTFQIKVGESMSINPNPNHAQYNTVSVKVWHMGESDQVVEWVYVSVGVDSTEHRIQNGIYYIREPGASMFAKNIEPTKGVQSAWVLIEAKIAAYL